MIDKRLADRNAPDHPLERVNEVQAVLADRIRRHKPHNAGDFVITKQYRYYNSLYFPYVSVIRLGDLARRYATGAQKLCGLLKIVDVVKIGNRRMSYLVLTMGSSTYIVSRIYVAVFRWHPTQLSLQGNNHMTAILGQRARPLYDSTDWLPRFSMCPVMPR
ncbi:hypothetical protein DIJ64_13570 [Mycobacterium leprae]|uniref:Uncharacterized protein n=1 Tax=Mycobacterium leprae TaxID=1769 RepID=A0AAD0P8T1_MYCLR|nr:hypothetical protein [Mycobacterium leprae]AWV48714.1 hypothetical protein DIJ64_13570 [Mycobacterium leprae]OAR19735.1 hypothetical protein A8144_13525 [Mycobacterium leprae 3125609]OAX70181.1 hypothetical protein A3216_13520 [Mycobacterium leprae 7935681]